MLCQQCEIEFRKNSNNQKYCKECIKQLEKGYSKKYYQNNKDKWIKYNNTPKKKEYMNLYNKQYKHKNRDKLQIYKNIYNHLPLVKERQMIYRKKYYLKNRAKLLDYGKIYSQTKGKEKRRNYHLNYYQTHNKEIKRKSRDYYINHKEKISIWYREYRKKNKDKIKKYKSEYFQRPDVKERIRNYRKTYISSSNYKEWKKQWTKDYNTRQYVKEKNRLYKEKNKVRLRSWNHKYHQRPDIKAKYREYARKKLRTDTNYRMSQYLRARLRQALHSQNVKKRDGISVLLGCPIEFLKNYLESQFDDEMSWGDYGKDGWHVDHIIPCASFDLSKEEEQKNCFNYANLQPLWASDNMSKNARINQETYKIQADRKMLNR